MHTLNSILCLRVLLILLCIFTSIGSLEASSRDEFGSQLSAVEQLRLKQSRGRLSSLERVLLLHLEVINVGTDSSFIAKGNYKAQDLDFDLSIVGKRPDSFRMTFKKNTSQYKIILDRGEYFDSKMKSKTDEFDLKDLRFMEIEANFLMLTWAYEISGLSDLELVEKPQVVNGSSCFRIVNTKLDYLKIDHFIDTDDGREVARHGYFEVNGTEFKVEMDYFPSESIGHDGSEWTGGYTMKVNGELHAEAKFDLVKRNTGVGSWMFKPTFD